jgi:chromosome segregation ATPase
MVRQAGRTGPQGTATRTGKTSAATVAGSEWDGQMTEIDTLESRIAAALDRIRRGVDAMDLRSGAAQGVADAAAETERVAALEARLDEEMTANAMLEERVKALKERQDDKIDTLETMLEKQRTQMVTLDQELQRLRQVNGGLRDMTVKLRDALAGGQPDASLVDAAVHAELDALRATRTADMAELDAVIDALRPMIEESR